MSTLTVFGTELKNKLLGGIKKLNESVSSTLGPGGRTVLIKDRSGEVKVTKDGVTVAKSFHELEDQVEDLGAQLVKQVSIKSANEAGDGTTTSTLLAATMVEEGLKLINQGSNPVEVKKGIDTYTKLIVEELKKLATDIATQEHIKNVGTISANGDTEVGELISTAIEKVGREGIVTIEESKTGETTLEVVEGMQFDRGYKSPYFVTNNNTMQAVLEDCYVMLYDGRISTAADLLNVLTKANSENKALLIVADDIGDEALATLIVNKMRGIVKVCAVKAPDFGERKTLLLEDMAVLTGGQVISKDKGYKLDKLTPVQLASFLGTARTVTVSKDDTTIIDGAGTEETIAQRAEEIKAQIDKATSHYEKEKLQERLGKLVGGVAIISVGGNSDIEIKERKDRVEDALYATKAALLEGVVPGGGVALIEALNGLAIRPKEISADEMKGYEIVKKACFAPFKRILENCGMEDYYTVLRDLADVKMDTAGDPSTFMYTYNVKTGTIVNAMEAGLLDPVKVTRTAIENAASVAGTILTTESVIFEKKEDKEGDQGMNMMQGF
jgi:chaperonin GroEL